MPILLYVIEIENFEENVTNKLGEIWFKGNTYIFNEFFHCKLLTLK